MTNLLTDPLISVVLTDGTCQRWSLPRIFEGLFKNEIAQFSYLQPHQEHGWFAFLVQLAAMVENRYSRNGIYTAESWRDGLRLLTSEYQDDAPWKLVVAELTLPAFMQIPIPENSLDAFKPDITSPDTLDILVTSKGHDIKQRKIVNPLWEHWIYALVNLQTMQGFLGRGNTGISRMNGGFGNRPCIAFIENQKWGTRFKRDFELFLDNYVEARHPIYHKREGHALLWLLPWNGSSQLRPEQLDPYFIEICRRIRFIGSSPSNLIAFKANSDEPRVAAKQLNGLMNDPWTPIESNEKNPLENQKSLTVAANGFRYEVAKKLIFKREGEKAPAQKLRKSDSEVGYIWMQALVRGQGKTEGYHERLVFVPGEIRSEFESQEHKLADLAEKFVDLAAIVEKILRRSIQLFYSKSDHSKSKNKQAEKVSGVWIQQFKDYIDQVFFKQLWAAVKLETESGKLWVELLEKQAWKLLQEFVSNSTFNDLQYYKARALAENLFSREIFKVNKKF